MQQLTGLDAAFLALETANATGHVGGVCVLDPREAPQPLTLARLTDVLADRLPLVPVLRRKLLNVPLGLAGREVPPSEPFTPGRPPGPVTLAALAAARLAWRPVQTVRIANEMVRVLPTLAPAAGSLVGGILGLNRGDGEVIATTPGRA